MNEPAVTPNLLHLSPIVTQFFEAFAKHDWRSIARCYHDKASYSDPLFPDLRGERIVYMWYQMLGTAGAKQTHSMNDLNLEYRILFGDERKAQVEWTANYVYAGRYVRIEGLTTLAIWDDKIVRHVNEYNFWRWIRQAKGLTGLVFGGLPAYQRNVQRSAQSLVDQAAGTMG